MSTEIKTSDKHWLKTALEQYKSKTPFDFVDDAKLGITPLDLVSGVGLIAAAYRMGFPKRKIIQILGSIGVCTLGIVLIMIAVVDPEPTSKFTILLVGGVVLAVGGGFSILWSLGHKYKVTASKDKFTIEPT